MSETSKLGLPFLFAGQAQTELAHNEALQRLDSFLFPLLGEVSGRAPPARPAVGRCYIVPEKATGDWTGADRNLACFSEAGWRFLPPFEGLTAVRQADGATAIYLRGQWNFRDLRSSERRASGKKAQVVRREAVPDAAGGRVVDVEARASLAAVIEVLRSRGIIEP